MKPNRIRSHVCPVCAASMVEAEDALLKQSLEALEMARGYLDELSEAMFGGPKKAKPASTSWYVQRAIDALSGHLATTRTTD